VSLKVTSALIRDRVWWESSALVIDPPVCAAFRLCSSRTTSACNGRHTR
jgi:hypothetical protein